MSDKHVHDAYKDPERLKLVLETWKKTIEVQQHFNDLGLRIRNYAVTVLTAILAATALALKDNVRVPAFGASTPLAAWLLGAGVIAWLNFYVMDRHWYHRLLRGAVEHGQLIEKALLDADVLPTIGLTIKITEASRGWRLRARDRISVWYMAVAIVLIALIIVLVVARDPSISR